MFQVKSFFKYSAVFLAALLSSTSMAAVDEPAGEIKSTFETPRSTSNYKPSIGLKLGMADAEGGNDALAYGLELAIEPYIPFAAGIELNGYSTSADDETPSMTRTEFLAKGTYNFGGTLPVIRHSYLGANLGPVWDNEANSNYINLGLGPLIGFDIPIGTETPLYSLGANAKYLLVGGARDDVFALNAMVKYWF